MREEDIVTIELSDGEEEIPSYPPRSPSMLSTCSDSDFTTFNNLTTNRTRVPANVTAKEEAPRQHNQSHNDSQTRTRQMPPPRRTSFHPNIRNHRNSFPYIPNHTSKATGTGSHTSFNIYIHNLSNTPAFTPSVDDDGDSDSIVILEEVPKQPSGTSNHPINPSIRIPTVLHPSSGSASTTGGSGLLIPNVSNAKHLSSSDTLMTPPPTPPSVRPLASPGQHQLNVGSTDTETRSSLAGQKRPAPCGDSVEPIASTSTQAKRIAHVPSYPTRQPQTENRPVDSSNTAKTNDHRERQDPVNTEKPTEMQSTSTTTAASTSTCTSIDTEKITDDLKLDFVSALNELTAKYASHVTERMKKTYDFGDKDELKRAIRKLKSTSKEISPSRNCLRAIFTFHEDIDRRNYDYEVKRLCRKQEEKREKDERERLFHDMAEELRNLESLLVELEERKKRKKWTPEEENLWCKTSKILGKRYNEYKKELGGGNDVLKELHAEVLRKVHLKGFTLYTEVNEAVEKYIDTKREMYIHGKIPFEEMEYPCSEELNKVVSDVSSLHRIGLTGDEIHKLVHNICEFMVSKIKPRRVRDFLDYLYVWTDNSEEQFKVELEKDPAIDPQNKDLQDELSTNSITAQSNIELALDHFGTSATQEEEEEDVGDLSESTESEDEDEDEEVQADRDFINDSDDRDENDNSNNRDASPIPSTSTSRVINTRSRTRNTSMLSTPKGNSSLVGQDDDDDDDDDGDGNNGDDDQDEDEDSEYDKEDGELEEDGEQNEEKGSENEDSDES